MALAASLALPVQDAQALTLGRLTVQSALGQPLRAEIEVPEINADEAASLQTSIAAPEAFRAAGLEYNAALQGMRVTPQRRADGRMVLQLSSDAAVTAPFVDLIVQVNWASGRVVRDYTILLDPPASSQAAPTVNTAPQVTPAPAAAPPTIVPPTPGPAAVPAPTPAPAPVPAAPATPSPVPSPPPAPAASPAAAPAPRPSPATPATPAPGPAGGQIVVKPGDTAGRIAAARKPADVSLDQMLVAMLRSNPDAFVDGNVNRIKAGAVLDVPSAEQAAATPAGEASQTITAQSRDFNAFRRRLAANAPALQADTAQRSASGRVQAQVADNRPAGAAPDRLTLSKGGVQAKAADERIAREKAARDSAERVAELSRNISELNQLGVATGAPNAAPMAAPATQTASMAAEASPPATAEAAAPAASAQAAGSAPEVTAALPTASAAEPAPATETTGWVNRLLGNPWVPVAAGALVALLAGFGLYRARQRRKALAATQADAATPHADSFFGGSGGQHVDTSVADAPDPAMGDPLGPLDAATAADPVAEADVYLAYGRDLQAQEILNEALRHTPERLALHAKLAEIHAKRRDLPALEALAEKAHALSGGTGPEWDRIAELGRTLDPARRLWADTTSVGAGLGGLAAGAGLAGAAALASREDGAAQTEPIEPPVAPPAPPAAALDFGIDLDLDLDPTTPPGTPAPKLDTAAAADASGLVPGAVPVTAAGPGDLPPPPLADDLDFDVDLDPATPPAPSTPDRAGPPAAPLDLGSLSLDLGEEPTAAVPDAADAPATADAALDANDPLATKLALAEEFSAIGDADGARALAEEVLAEATGPLKAQAERFLADLA